MPDEELLLNDEDAEEVAPAPRKKKGAAYIGGGSFIQGIPARDLSAEEWAALSKAKQDALIEAGIMEVK